MFEGGLPALMGRIFTVGLVLFQRQIIGRLDEQTIDLYPRKEEGYSNLSNTVRYSISYPGRSRPAS